MISTKRKEEAMRSKNNSALASLLRDSQIASIRDMSPKHNKSIEERKASSKLKRLKNPKMNQSIEYSDLLNTLP